MLSKHSGKRHFRPAVRAEQRLRTGIVKDGQDFRRNFRLRLWLEPMRRASKEALSRICPRLGMQLRQQFQQSVN